MTEKKFCPNCGNKLVEGATFCTNCGFNLKENGQASSNISSNNVNDSSDQQNNKPTATSNIKDQNETLYTVLGWVCAGISLLFFPILFGAGGVVFGYLLARNESSKTKGVILIIFSIALAILGTLFGAAVGGGSY